MNIYEQIGRRLKKAREAAGLTQEQVSIGTGIQREMISYYENGKRQMDVATIQQLANFYGYSCNYFIEGIDEPEVKFAFRANEIDERDLETIGWLNTLVNNLYQMNRLAERGYR